MGLPSKRRTKSSKLRRASHFALKKIKTTVCPKCQKPSLSHRACSFCGYYRGQAVLKIKLKKKSGAKGKV
jgi:large subunit ribosomal protein L32